MRLVVIEVPGLPAGMQQRQEFELQPDPARPKWIIGRQMGSDIHLIDPSVSRTHAEVSIHPDGLLVRDLGSANGTFINERPMLPLSPTLLRPGERLRLGNVLTLLEGGPVSDHFNAATSLNAPVAGYPPAGSPAQNQVLRNSLPQTAPLGQGNPPPQPPRQVRPEPATPAPVSYNPSNYNPSNQPNPGIPPVPPSFNIDPPSSSYKPLSQMPAGPEPRYDSAGYRYDHPPEQDYRMPSSANSRAARKSQPFAKPKKRGPRWGLILAIVLVLLVGLSVGGYFYYTLILNPTTTLPAAIFKSPANNEQILGLNVSRPSTWKRNDPTPSQILFFLPENAKTVLNIEQPPSPSIVSASYTPEQAVKQYVANVKANASKVQVETEPAATKLKDGTPATLSRLVFSTDGAKAAPVTDYHMLAISFKCGNQLYFVSAAAEDSNYAASKQDLDASIANLTCFVGQG